MKQIILIFLMAISKVGVAQEINIQSPVRFLALGDSYTIGENVAANQRWPAQLGDSLTKRGYDIDEIRYIATTGWRTDNLIQAIKNQNLESQNYNLVSLLIGVNNQYQGRPFSQYQSEFPALLDSAIRYAGGDPSHVFVVSIPDYAYTPFGQQSSNPEAISQALDQYNDYSRQVSADKGVVYFDITPISRLGLLQPSLVAGDNLHPSGLQYTEWVKLILTFLDSQTAAISSNKISLFSIYPNPATENINIDLTSNLKGRAHVQLINLNGEVMFDKKFRSKQITIPTDNFIRGIYFIKVKVGDKIELRKVLVSG